MIAKFDSFSRYETPLIMLCGADSVYQNGTVTSVIGYVSDISDEELILNFSATSELNFRAYKVERDDADDNAVMLNIYDKLKNRRLLFVDGVGYFAITNVDECFGDDGTYKDITATSCEIEFENRKVPFIGQTSTTDGETDVDYTYKFTDLLDLLVGSVPKWTYDFRDIDSAVADKYRTFEDVDTDENILAFMQREVQEAYECIFDFDIINRQVAVYDQASFATETNIHLTLDGLINELDISENSDDIYTALSVFGDSDDVSINGVNPLGTNIIYNFDYYIPWMSAALQSRLAEWKEGISVGEEFMRDNYVEYTDIKQQYLDTQYEIERLEQLISLYKKAQANITVALQNPPASMDSTDKTEADAASVAKATEIIDDYNKEIKYIFGEDADCSAYEIDSSVLNIENNSIGIPMEKAEADLAAAESKLASLSSSLEYYEGGENSTGVFDQLASTYKLRTFLGDELYIELSNYIYEGTYSDQYITITDKMTQAEIYEQCFTLYDRAKAQLKKVSAPTQKFDVDAESFVFVKEFLPWSKQLKTGTCVNVELAENEIASLFLTTITVNFYDKTLKLTFGNRLKRNDPRSLYEDVLGDIRKTANTLSYLNEVVSPVKVGVFDDFAQELQNSRNLTMRNALASANQSFSMDNYGITGTSLTEEGSTGPYQIKITNESIVFTTDNWKTCSTALGRFYWKDDKTGMESIYGVNAQAVVAGKIMGSEIIGGTIEGTTVTGATIIGGKIQTASGKAWMENGTITGATIVGGKIQTSSGEAWMEDGAIYGSTITGSAISGGSISGTTITGTTITGTTISGGKLSGTTISGGSININDRFTVDESGDCSIDGGSINISDNFKVDSSGNVTLKGNITWGADNKPTTTITRAAIANALYNYADCGDGIYTDGNGNIAINASLINAGELNVDNIKLYSTLGNGRIMGLTGSIGVGIPMDGIGMVYGTSGSPIHYFIVTQAGVRMQAGSARVVATGTRAYLQCDDTEYQVYTDASGCGCSAASFSTGSDRRLKDNISYDYEKYIGFFMQLKPAMYHFRPEHSEVIHTGFIAQDVEEALISNGLTASDFGGLGVPSSGTADDFDVSEYNLSEIYRLGYSEFTSLNTYMIQKLYKRVDELEKVIAELRSSE